METYAIVRESDGLVINTIVATSAYQPPAGHIVVAMSPTLYGGPGWFWTGSAFVDPNPAPPDLGDASGGN